MTFILNPIKHGGKMPKIHLTPVQGEALSRLYLGRYYSPNDTAWYLPSAPALFDQLAKKGLVDVAIAGDKFGEGYRLTEKEKKKKCYQLTDKGRAVAWDWIINHD